MPSNPGPDVDLLSRAREVKSTDAVIPHDVGRLLLVRIEALELAIEEVFKAVTGLMEGGDEMTNPAPAPEGDGG